MQVASSQTVMQCICILASSLVSLPPLTRVRWWMEEKPVLCTSSTASTGCHWWWWTMSVTVDCWSSRVLEHIFQPRTVWSEISGICYMSTLLLHHWKLQARKNIWRFHKGIWSSFCKGEGLYARRDIDKDSLVCCFSGARKRHFRNDNYDWSDYCIKLDENCSIDIPDHYIPVNHYCATLAHKVKIVIYQRCIVCSDLSAQI